MATLAVSPLRLALLALAWAGFIVYGSLLPFEHNGLSWEQAWARFQDIPYLDLDVVTRADWVANILLYMPLAFALTGALALRLRSVAARVLVGVFVALLGVALAVTVEFMQQFFPPRTVSINDLIAETIGTVLGVLAWLAFGPRLLALWGQLSLGGAPAWRALLWLYALAYGALALFPFDLLVSAQELTAKLANPGLVGWGVAGGCGGALGCSLRLGVEAAAVMPLGALLALVFVRLRVVSAFAAGLLLGLAIEAAQLLLASGVTITWAHWALLKNNRRDLIAGLILDAIWQNGILTGLALILVEFGVRMLALTTAYRLWEWYRPLIVLATLGTAWGLSRLVAEPEPSP